MTIQRPSREIVNCTIERNTPGSDENVTRPVIASSDAMRFSPSDGVWTWNLDLLLLHERERRACNDGEGARWIRCGHRSADEQRVVHGIDGEEPWRFHRDLADEPVRAIELQDLAVTNERRVPRRSIALDDDVMWLRVGAEAELREVDRGVDREALLVDDGDRRATLIHDVQLGLFGGCVPSSP
jgi:hypothetical protein